jgi:hypothetical protein
MRYFRALAVVALLVLSACSFFLGETGREPEANKGEQQAQGARQQSGGQESKQKLDVKNQVQSVLNEDQRREGALAGKSPQQVKACMGDPAENFGGGGTGLAQWVYYAGAKGTSDSFSCKITFSFDSGKVTDANIADPRGQALQQPPAECLQKIQSCGGR